MTKKIIEITVETERLLYYHRRKLAARAWCLRCDSEVSVVTPTEAASLAGLSQSVIRTLLETGVLHSMTTAEGEIFICLRSLRS